jgi:hypothetical protein
MSEPVRPKFHLEEPEERPEPGSAVERAEVVSIDDHRNRAVADLAQEAIEQGVLGRDEFLTLAMTARMLSMSGAAPKLVRNNPYVAFHVALVGRDLGISPSAAVELIDVLDTQGGPRLSLSPQLVNGQLERLGLGVIRPVLRTRDRCVARAYGPGGPDQRCVRLGSPDHVEGCACDVLGDSEFTWEDARDANLVGPDCQPRKHEKSIIKKDKNGNTYKVCGCNQGYITYGSRMLWWRAAGFAADDYFPTAGLGLYQPEALGAAIDEQGRAIDVGTIELPEGYQPEPPKPKASETPADPEALWALQERIAALPDEQKAEMRDRWKGSDTLKLYRPADLPASAITLATAMIKGFEAKAVKADPTWDADVTRERVRIAVGGQLLVAFGIFPGLEPPVDDAEPAPAGDDTPTDEPSEPGEAPVEPGEPSEPSPAPESPGGVPAPSPATTGPNPTLISGEDPADMDALVSGFHPELVDEVREQVKAMRAGEVAEALDAQGLPTTGKVVQQRLRLVARLVRLRIEEQA